MVVVLYFLGTEDKEESLGGGWLRGGALAEHVQGPGLHHQHCKKNLHVSSTDAVFPSERFPSSIVGSVGAERERMRPLYSSSCVANTRK